MCCLLICLGGSTRKSVSSSEIPAEHLKLPSAQCQSAILNSVPTPQLMAPILGRRLLMQQPQFLGSRTWATFRMMAFRAFPRFPWTWGGNRVTPTILSQCIGFAAPKTWNHVILILKLPNHLVPESKHLPPLSVLHLLFTSGDLPATTKVAGMSLRGSQATYPSIIYHSYAQKKTRRFSTQVVSFWPSVGVLGIRSLTRTFPRSDGLTVRPLSSGSSAHATASGIPAARGFVRDCWMLMLLRWHQTQPSNHSQLSAAEIPRPQSLTLIHPKPKQDIQTHPNISKHTPRIFFYGLLWQFVAAKRIEFNSELPISCPHVSGDNQVQCGSQTHRHAWAYSDPENHCQQKRNHPCHVARDGEQRIHPTHDLMLEGIPLSLWWPTGPWHPFQWPPSLGDQRKCDGNGWIGVKCPYWGWESAWALVSSHQVAPVQNPRTQTLAKDTKIAWLGASRSMVYSDPSVLPGVLRPRSPQSRQGRSSAPAKKEAIHCPPRPAVVHAEPMTVSPKGPPEIAPVSVDVRWPLLTARSELGSMSHREAHIGRPVRIQLLLHAAKSLESLGCRRRPSARRSPHP